MPKGQPPAAELRLRAEDAEDLAVISACLQDALVAVRDLAYDRDARVFVLVVNRGFHRSEEDRILSLLAIRPAPGPGTAAESGAIDLEFAGGATIRLAAAT